MQRKHTGSEGGILMHPTTRRTLLLAGSMAAIVFVFGFATLKGRASNSDVVQRGEYLVKIAGCNDCHTPLKMGPNGPEPDMSRMLSGHPEQIVINAPAPHQPEPWLSSFTGTNTAWSGPWGVSFTMNLTPDMETGTGKWTFRNFKDTIRSGRHFGRGRQILPPM